MMHQWVSQERHLVQPRSFLASEVFTALRPVIAGSTARWSQRRARDGTRPGWRPANGDNDHLNSTAGMEIRDETLRKNGGRRENGGRRWVREAQASIVPAMGKLSTKLIMRTGESASFFENFICVLFG